MSDASTDGRTCWAHSEMLDQLLTLDTLEMEDAREDGVAVSDWAPLEVTGGLSMVCA